MPEYAVATKRGLLIVTVVSDGSDFQVTFDGQTYPTKLQPWLGSTHYRLIRSGSVVPVVIRAEHEEWVVGIADEQYRMRVTRHVPVARKNETSVHATSRDVKAPMPGLVVSVAVKVGDTVEAGRALAIVEAMKMQSEIRAPIKGRISSVRAQAGQEVMGGAVLLTIEPFA